MGKMGMAPMQLTKETRGKMMTENGRPKGKRANGIEEEGEGNGTTT
jgi:hypothetical protein